MNYKYIFKNAASLLLIFALITSCDNNNGNDPTPPSVSAPSPSSVNVGVSTDISFNVSTSEGYQSATATASSGSATISSEPESGAPSGEVVVSYTGDTEGAGSVDLVVTDQADQTAKATAVINVGVEQTEFTITDNITSDQTWEQGNTYILGGRITVEAGATLTIEGGTLIKGEGGEGANATALLVAREATLNANGTADAPIIFTSNLDEITPDMIANGNFGSPNLSNDQQGLWGGVIVLGNAPISASNDGGDVTELQIEGIPPSDTNGLYGGNDPEDSSGSISYITIRHGGSNIGDGNEINGLTLGGVGSGTTIENVEVVANQDDGVEWFGGTVSVTNVLVWNNGDDAIDTDQAWEGTLDNVVIVTPGDSPFELDGPEGSNNGATADGSLITNGSIYVMGNGSEEVIDVDESTDANLSNLLFFGLTSGNIVSSDYTDYAAAGNYSFSDFEAVIPSGSSLSDIFTGGSDSAVTAIAGVGSASVGADASVFGWTWASQSGRLADIGLE